MENNTECKPVLVFIPSGAYNTISHKILFYDFLERMNFSEFKLKREFTFIKVIKILRKYDFRTIIVFNVDDLSPTYLLKKILIKLCLKKGINILEINSGLSLFSNSKPDFSTIQYLICRGEYSRLAAKKFFKKIYEKTSLSC